MEFLPDHRNVAVLHRPVKGIRTEDGVDGLVGLGVDIGGNTLSGIDFLVVDGDLVLGRHGDWRSAAQAGREVEKASTQGRLNTLSAFAVLVQRGRG